MELIGEDIAVQVSFGGVVDGAPAWDAEATVIKCMARRISTSQSVSDIDITTLCSASRRERPGRASTSVEIEGLVPAAGYSFKGASTGVGTYIKVETKPLSTLSTFDSWVGYIAEWSWDASLETAQVERVRINCNAVVDA